MKLIWTRVPKGKSRWKKQSGGWNGKRLKRGAYLLAVSVLALLVGTQFWGIGESVVTIVAYHPQNWGLSFGAEGEKPRGNAEAEFLAQYNSYYVAPTDEKVIYLTFDAGYENGNTEKILDALKKHNAPATFFLVGHYIESSPDLVKRMVAEGHIVGNHTMHHPNMSKIGEMEKFKKEITDLEALYQECTGQEMKKFYRPPEGKFSESNLKQAQQLGYTTCFWSLAYADWYEEKQPTPEEAYAKLLPRIHPGAIVLLHSTSSTNAEIMDDLLTKWEEMGYTFGSLEDLNK